VKRTRIDIEDISSLANLVNAAIKAAQGKRAKKEVIRFFNNFDNNLAALRQRILTGNIPYREMKKFIIHDPKQRVIHAPCFHDRVFHHCLMNHVGPVLDRSMVATSYACRVGKGIHAAVAQVQKNIQRFQWYVRIDIKSFFDSIDHDLLLKGIERRIKGKETIKLIRKVITGYEVEGRKKGLPIGTLPSQHFANYFLDSLDRLIMEKLDAQGHVRYMDDIIWWCKDKKSIKLTLAQVTDFVENSLNLKIKEGAVRINRSTRGVSFCGVIVFSGKKRLSLRKRRNYASLRKKWEYLCGRGVIDSLSLQAGYSSVKNAVQQADSKEWRKSQLERHVPPDF
jgi:RNA-directed DNA polymerase